MTIGLNGPIPPRYEDACPEEAAKLVGEIAARSAMKKKGKRVKPLFLNGIQPAVKSNEVGRNEKCPCGSGKKYKKCCLT